MDLRAHIGARVKMARSAIGLTQEELAEALGKSTRTISSIESGHALTSLSTLERMGRVLGRPPAYFLEDFGAKTRTRAGPGESLLKMIAAFSAHDLALATSLMEALRDHSQRGAYSKKKQPPA